ncbi:hypothetical protein RRG08_005740 [Elysia crispata]|uniref:Uncharacterized protein n=1 Tax=Elysia crispata TaxID=231223 RepID=A0AAE1CWB3_9GAST|nr:hypothetical protein RRG08_005740 [Elysia crispata]
MSRGDKPRNCLITRFSLPQHALHFLSSIFLSFESEKSKSFLSRLLQHSDRRQQKLQWLSTPGLQQTWDIQGRVFWIDENSPQGFQLSAGRVYVSTHLHLRDSPDRTAVDIVLTITSALWRLIVKMESPIIRD